MQSRQDIKHQKDDLYLIYITYMKLPIYILLFFAPMPCLAQKYKTCKVYQYEGDDSTNAKLVLTKKYYLNGKISSAIYDNYKAIKDEEDDYSENGATYYTYRDSFLIETLTAHRANTWNIDGPVLLNTYLNGDSFLTLYEYVFDNNNRIKNRKIIKTEKAFRWVLCGMTADLLDDSSNQGLAFREEYYKMLREADKNKKWNSPTTTIYTYEYDNCGIIAEEAEYREGTFVVRNKYLYQYEDVRSDYNLQLTTDMCRLTLKETLTSDNYTTGYRFSKYDKYLYEENRLRVYEIYGHNIKQSNFNDSDLIIKVPCTHYYYNKKKQPISKITNDYVIHYEYDNNARLANLQLLEDGKVQLTHIYQYE
ncbi:hypothetical protein CAP35_10215 [Chitinophagaceae bacterium IBVUCB1]|nr:hypothetical protein CAP35_10215 [Chitinophagaceae bacterium IBVUCB1]